MLISEQMTIRGFYICITKHSPLTDLSTIYKYKSDSFISY